MILVLKIGYILVAGFLHIGGKPDADLFHRKIKRTILESCGALLFCPDLWRSAETMHLISREVIRHNIQFFWLSSKKR